MHYKIYSSHKCSDHFIYEHVDGGRCSYIECEACGRTICTDPNVGTYDPGEYEKLQARSINDKSGYVFLGNGISSISYGILNGIQVVFDCPCNYARIVEDELKPGEAQPLPLILKPGTP